MQSQVNKNLTSIQTKSNELKRLKPSEAIEGNETQLSPILSGAV
jgi:hypothetical protein